MIVYRMNDKYITSFLYFQVGFLSQICIPCYKVLYRILPKTKPMYVMALKNLHNWKLKADRARTLKYSGELFDDSEIEDIPEEILLQGEPDINEEEEESDTKDVQDNVDLVAEVKQEENVEEILREDEREILSTEGADGTWDEDDKIKNEEKIGGRLSKDIEGVTWIDEEGVVLRPNGVLKEYNNSGAT